MTDAGYDPDDILAAARMGLEVAEVIIRAATSDRSKLSFAWAPERVSRLPFPCTQYAAHYCGHPKLKAARAEG